MTKPKTIFATSKAINSPAPKWANITWYIILGFLTAFSTWLYSTNLVSASIKPEINLVITILTPFLYGLKKLTGTK